MTESYPAFNFKETPLSGVTLIQASAGTGKTYSLERLVARLIVEEDVEIETMLLMTFTKAATAELSSRIRSLLLQLRESWSNRDLAVDADVQELIEHWQNQSDLDEGDIGKRLSKAVNSFDDASIFTIHSFCQKMLTEYVFSRGGGFGLEVGEDTEQTEQALDEFLRKVYAENQENREFIDELQLWKNRWHEKLDQLKSQPLSVRQQVDVLSIENDKYLPSDAMRECLKVFAVEVPDRINELKQQQKVMTFDDMLLELHQSLENQDVVDGIRKRFRAVLVDEFQDTDSIQFSIFKTLFLDASASKEALPQAVFFVGDPKQAIYGFRSAELETYFEAVRFIKETGNRIYDLPQNFRSAPAIIQAVNTLFSKSSGADGFEDRHSFLDDGIQYTGTKATSGKLPLMRKVEQNGITEWQPVPAFELWTNDLNTEASEFKEEAIQAHFAKAIAEDIVRLLDRQNGTVYCGKRPLEAKDIAILVKERPNADVLKKELIKRNIRTRLESKENVFKSNEAFEILALLLAMASPDDNSLLTAARSTRLVGHNLKSIQQDVNELASFRQDMREASDRIVFKGIYPEFSRLMHDRFQTVDRLLQLTGGERMLTNYQHILEIMQAQQQKIGGDLAGIIHWLKATMNENYSLQESDDSRNLRIESDANVVNIVTIHASKGLEYPVVYLVDALETRLAASRGRSIFKEYEGSQKKLLFVPDNKAVSKHPASCIREEQETVRLAYVAMTRASSRLVLPLALGRPDKGHDETVIDVKSLQSAYVRALFGSMTNYEKAPKFSKKERVWQVFCKKVAQWQNNMQSGFNTMADALRANYCSSYEDFPLKANLQPDDFFCFRNWQDLPVDGEPLANLYEIRYDVVPSGKISQAWSRSSFTGIARGLEEAHTRSERSGFFTFPRGTEAGDSLHKLIESIINQGVACQDSQAFDALMDNMDQIVEKWLEKEPFYRRLKDKTGLYDADSVSIDGIVGDEIDQQAYCQAWLKQRVRTLLNAELPNRIVLKEVIQSRKVVSELKFLLSSPGEGPEKLTVQQLSETLDLPNLSVRSDRHSDAQWLNGYLTGEIDMLFRHRDGKYWIIDWKSNAIETKTVSSDNPVNYTQKNMEEVMDEHHYKLQALCYLVALYRYLQQMHPQKTAEEVMGMLGGAMYVFLRGVGGNTEEMPDGSYAHNGVFIMPIDSMKKNLLALDQLLGQKGKMA